MKLGSVGWGWTLTPEDMPVGDSLEHIAGQVKELGFDIVDYLSDYDSLDTYFTPEACKRIGAHCRGLGLEIGGLVFQSDTWNSSDKAVAKRQLDYFRKCAEAAKSLGATAISCIIPIPEGAKPNRAGSPSEKRAYNVPDDYSWQRDWDNYISQMRNACDVAAEYGLRIALECFPGSLCATPHAMLLAIEQIGRPNFGIQLDTAHLMNQHIDIETAIHMLGGKNIFNVHAKDSDGMARGNLPCGVGLVDYTAVFRALRNVGYGGNISIEVEFTDNPRRYMKQALEHLRLCMTGEY